MKTPSRSGRHPLRLLSVDLDLLRSRHKLSRCAYHWVTDESIAAATGFDDPAIPHHELTHRANRIASIVKMMGSGTEFDPLRIDVVGNKIHLRDGHHRLRAYQFRRHTGAVQVLASGDVDAIAHAIL